MLVNSIERGIVIDHITAGLGNRIIDLLDLDLSAHTVAFIMNATSSKHGKKDIVKVENVSAEDINIDILGLVEPNATVNVIENGKIVRKIALTVPEKVKNIIKCKNPRCVTSIEAGIPHIFHLVDAETGEYRCEYCDEIVAMKGEK